MRLKLSGKSGPAVEFCSFNAECRLGLRENVLGVVRLKTSFWFEDPRVQGRTQEINEGVQDYFRYKKA